jgi:hypothetical protein
MDSLPENRFRDHCANSGFGACFFGIMPEHLQHVRAEFGMTDEYDRMA